MPDDIKIVAEFCKAKLGLENTDPSDEDDYQSLPLCVIDAVFSISANYTSTKNTVAKFCNHFGVRETSKVRPPDIADQLSISNFLKFYDQYGVEKMAGTVYQNLQRTSSRNGILKSEAVLRFSKTLIQFGVDYFQAGQESKHFGS